MIDLGIESYLFGKVADFTFSALMEKLEIKKEKDKKKIEKAIETFKKYLTDRHIENPYYEAVISLWEEYQVCEELIKIRYSLDSEFESYSEFKKHFSEKFEGRTDVKDFSNNLMDELNEYLSDTVRDTSNLTQADIAVHKEMHEKTRSELSNLAKEQDKNHQELLKRIGTRKSLSPNQYYNLFVMAEEEAYEETPFHFLSNRILERGYTTKALINKFSNFNFEDIQEIINLPTLFLPEYPNDDIEKVGYLGKLLDIDVDLDSKYSKFYFERINKISMMKLSQLKSSLNIERLELQRTHWAIKRANLSEKIEELIISSDDNDDILEIEILF